ncbi:hypothetical protein MBANPS3_002632 [Mucor bainieri]
MSQNFTTINNRFENMVLSLDGSQSLAVYSREAALKITAEPGTGKTYVLICRVAKWVLVDGIDPSAIVVLAYSKYAVTNLKEKLFHVLGRDVASRLDIRTFHSICLHYLSRERSAHGNPSEINCNATRQRWLDLLRAVQDDQTIEIDDSRRQANQATHILDEIMRAKRQGMTHQEYAAQYAESQQDHEHKDYAIIFKRYQELLIEKDLFDFNEILYQCAILIVEKPSCIAHIKHVVVDSYESVDPLMKRMIDALSSAGKSITIAGDENQAIFGWRHAGGLDYSNYFTIYLQHNYRNTKLLTQAATEMISDRTMINTQQQSPVGAPASLLFKENEFEQANFVAEEVLRLVHGSNGILSFSDCAVLLRTHAMSLRFEEAFRARLIPYELTDVVPFYNREEVVEIMDYLQFSLYPNDHNFSPIINIPNRNISQGQVNAILRLSASQDGNIIETLKAIAGSDDEVNNGFSAEDKSKLRYMADVCSDVKKLVEGQRSIIDVLEFIIQALNYRAHVRRKKSSFEDRWSNVEELCTTAVEVYTNRPAVGASSSKFQNKTSAAKCIDADVRFNIDEDRVRGFLRHALDRRNARAVGVEDEKVAIITIHSSKGCEWPCVFIPSCIEGFIPIFKANECIDIDEECRLLYVAMTRARFFLYCIVPKARFIVNSDRDEQISRFLEHARAPTYSGQVPVWSDRMRAVLAQTLRRNLPAAANPHHARNFPYTQ